MPSDTATEGNTTKAEEMRIRKEKTARQKFDRLANDAVVALDELLTHTRETAGILNEEQVGVLSTAVVDRAATLRSALEAHAAAPIKVKGKQEKKKAFSLF